MQTGLYILHTPTWTENQALPNQNIKGTFNQHLPFRFHFMPHSSSLLTSVKFKANFYSVEFVFCSRERSPFIFIHPKSPFILLGSKPTSFSKIFGAHTHTHTHRGREGEERYNIQTG